MNRNPPRAGAGFFIFNDDKIMRKTKIRMRRNKTKGGYADTQTVIAFSFITFVLAFSIPAKFAIAQATFFMGNVSSLAIGGTANIIGATPAFSLFALGFVSAMLFLGVIWDKFSLIKIPAVSRSRGKGKTMHHRNRKGGFISLELASTSILSILLVTMISSPVFV